MKVHYINILLFALPLNILVNNQRNHYITLHTTTRLLCECDLYMPNYNNDPEMQKVMENYNRHTSERFKVYGERMIKSRQKCKEQCDKDIQKIILKDKIEEELAEKLATLEIKIDTNDLPTCVCEKSVVDKVEKTCSKCAGVLGGGITPGWGLIIGIVYTGWKAAALADATKEAIAEGAAKGLAEGAQAGIKTVMDLLGSDFGLSIQGVQNMGLVFNAKNYYDVSFIYQAVYPKFQGSCLPPVPFHGASPGPYIVPATDKTFCSTVLNKVLYGNVGTRGISIPDAIKKNVETMVLQAKDVAGAHAEAVTEEATVTLTIEKTGEINAAYASFQTAIIASVVAILVIVLVMVIIYLILRYRRKKKMKKKLQYIKLLKE
ncbi:PIR protein, putative [Plasmodium sp.]|nr:PIR protein, putative [Plasmodium sp.]